MNTQNFEDAHNDLLYNFISQVRTTVCLRQRRKCQDTHERCVQVVAHQAYIILVAAKVNDVLLRYEITINYDPFKILYSCAVS